MIPLNGTSELAEKFRDRTAYRLATVREREGETKCFMDMGFFLGL